MVDPHTHEFREPTREIVEDGSWVVQYDCSHVEILGAQTCDRLDETFYEEGASCEASKSVRLDASRLERVVMGESNETLAEGESVLLGDCESGDVPEELACQIEQTIVSELGRDFQPHDVSRLSGDDVQVVDASEQSRVVDVTVSDLADGYEHLEGTYRVFYDNPEVTVDEY